MNPLLTGIMNPQAKQLMQTIKASQNPQMALQQLMQNNPGMKQAIDYVNANGGNPKDAFYKLAKERGVDPESILNSLK